jgi:ribosome biogenesis GTPase
MNIRELGFDGWFAARAEDMDQEGLAPARVSAVDRGACLVSLGGPDIPAELSGRLWFQADSPDHLPCVGDFVAVRLYNAGQSAIIERVLPRRTFLRRRAAGDSSGTQMIAANIDMALLVQSCRYDFNPARLERYLVMAAEGGVEAAVLLTKTDLARPGELAPLVEALQGAAHAPVIPVSCVAEGGLDGVLPLLRPGRTFCLLGSSGVGKTTLLNRLLGREAFATGAVSATGEGTHTTTRRQLARLVSGALCIDTPGMRELGVAAGQDGLDAGFADVAELAAGCRYADCRHEGEPGCAVRAALDSGALCGRRFANYLKLRRETEHMALSGLEKRRKDKAFGKMAKAYKKQARGA